MMGDTLRIMVDVNDTDKHTMQKLKEQTDMIKGSQNKLSDAEGYVSRSEGVIRNMLRRVFTNKLVLFAIIILLGLLNAFLIYVKVKYNILGIRNN